MKVLLPVVNAWLAIRALGISDPARADIAAIRSWLAPLDALADFTPSQPVIDYRALLTAIDAAQHVHRDQQQRLLTTIAGFNPSKPWCAQARSFQASLEDLSECRGKDRGASMALCRRLYRLTKTGSIPIFNSSRTGKPMPLSLKNRPLVTAMEELVGADVPPESLAKQIKALQVQWKALDHRVRNTEEETLWQQFSQVADRAYQPCKAHYAQLAALREQNAAETYGIGAAIAKLYWQ